MFRQTDLSKAAPQPTSFVYCHQRAAAHRFALLTLVTVLTLLVLWPARDVIQSTPKYAVASLLPASQQSESQSTKVSASVSKPTQPKPVSYTTRTVQAAGWIEPAPYAIAVSGLADGVVEKVHVLEGETVKAGQLLVELDPLDAQINLQHTKANYAAALAQVTQAQVQLNAAQANWDHPTAQTQAVDTARAQIDHNQALFDRLPAEKKQAAAFVNRWQAEVDRLTQARHRDAATANELSIAQANLMAQQAALEALEQETSARAATIQQAKANYRAAQEDAELRINERQALDAAKAKLAQAQAQLQISKAALDASELKLKRMSIYAPQDGFVLRRFVAPGDKVMLGMDMPTSAQVIHLYDPQKLQVRVDVPLADASQIQIHQSCQIIADVLPDQVFSGTVTHITHLADLQKNTLEIKVQIDRPSKWLKPDMLAKVKFLGQTQNNASSKDHLSSAKQDPSTSAVMIRAPKQSLVNNQIWRIQNRQGLKGQVQPIAVKLVSESNQTDSTWITVKGDLHVGDLVVLNPAGLTPGETIQMTNKPLASSDMNQGDV